MTEYHGVMVYGEMVDGKLATITKELLGCGRTLAKALGEDLMAVFVGSHVGHLADETIQYGADKVMVVENPLFGDYRTDSFVSAMAKVIEDKPPRILILGQTSVGQDLAPRLAFRLNTTVVLDCVELSLDPDSKLLLRTKPVYGGKAWAIFSSDCYPQMATVRSKSMSPLERDPARKGEVIKMDIGLGASLVRTMVLEKITEEREGIRLEDAEIIISGGRGIGGQDGFKQLEELSKLLKGATVGATRAACDAGWVPSTLQVGLTGKVVTPKVYVAVALSGSSQHMAGCSGAETIVSINKDPSANIFKEAKFGVVGDWKMVLPTFIKKIVELSKD
jgi:electron transfer flavoprotein alpha subunit